MLTRREHSARELAYKLTARGFPQSSVDDVIAELQKQGWQSDRRFAESYIRARRERGHGPVRIRFELQQKGLDSELVDTALNSSGIDWELVLKQIYRQKYSDKPIASESERAKRWRFLQQRGFAYEQIHRLLDDR